VCCTTVIQACKVQLANHCTFSQLSPLPPNCNLATSTAILEDLKFSTYRWLQLNMKLLSARSLEAIWCLHISSSDSEALSGEPLTLTCHSQHRHSPGTDPTPALSAVSHAHLFQVDLTKFLSAAAETANWKIYAITLNQNHFSLTILHSGVAQILAVWKQKCTVPLL